MPKLGTFWVVSQHDDDPSKYSHQIGGKPPDVEIFFSRFLPMVVIIRALKNTLYVVLNMFYAF